MGAEKEDLGNPVNRRRETRYVPANDDRSLDRMGEILALRGNRLQKLVGALTLMNVGEN